MKTLTEVLTKFPQEILDRYDFSAASYKGALARMEGVKCLLHGKFSQYAAQFRKNGAGCPRCGEAKRIEGRTSSELDYIRRAKEIHKVRGYDYSHVRFTRMNALITVGCPTHGGFAVSANKHLYRAQGCPTCATEGRRLRAPMIQPLASASKIANTAKGFFLRCAEVHSGLYSYPEQTYLGAKHKVRVVCPKHGEFLQVAWGHLRGRGCKQCVHKSQPEITIEAFLSQYTSVDRGRRDLIAPKELDFYLPEFNLGVEFHGLYHHLTSKRGLLHREKWALAQKAGIRLVQIFEDEWLNKQDIVKARLLAFIGKSEKRDARKLVLKDVQWEEARDFLAITHIQGAGPVGAAYGLYEGGRLMAVATFGRSRSGAMMGARKEGEYEVLRYASIGSVRGGFTRLFAQFKKDFTPDKVISYCDLRYGTGGLYRAAGFELAGVTEPDYWWVPRGKIERVSRYSAQKHKMKKANHPLNAYYAVNKTERMICEEAGWEQIHGVGNQKWVWSNPLS